MEYSMLVDKIVTDDICYLIKSFDFRVMEFGTIHTAGKNLKKEQFTLFYRLAYIEKGPVYFSYGNEKLKIGDDCLVYLPPETTLYGEEDADISVWFLNYQMGNLSQRQKYNDYMKETFTRYYVKDQNHICRDIFADLLEEGKKKEMGYCICVQGKFVDLLVHMIRMSQNVSSMQVADNRNTSTYALYNQAILYINENIKRNIKVKEIADAVGISEVYLYKVFMKQAGKSPQQMLKAYRLQLAKDYLNDPTISIKTIAYELGFISSAYFSTAFKNEVGITPREYRKKELSRTDREIKNTVN